SISVRPSPTVADPGFEAPAVGAGPMAYAYAPGGSAWSFAGSSGVAADGSGFTAGNPPAPEGAQAALLQGTGRLSQAVDVAAGAAGAYRLSFRAAQRANWQTGGYHDFAVLIDGVEAGRFRPATTAYEALQLDLVLSAGVHTVAFVGLNSAGGDNS